MDPTIALVLSRRMTELDKLETYYSFDDVLDMKDLKPGMILKGTVRNVIDFGVFVDIGVHQDGLEDLRGKLKA